MKVDFSGKWIYHFANHTVERLDVQFEQKDHTFTVKIPFGGASEGIEIQLHYKPHSNKLSGTWRDISEKIPDEPTALDAHILDDGKRLELYPEGFNIRKVWVFECEQTAQTPSQNNSYGNMPYWILNQIKNALVWD